MTDYDDYAKEGERMDINTYKRAVEFLIAEIEYFIEDTLLEYGLEIQLKKEIEKIKERIKIVRKFED